ncbi:hypothetical protein ACEPPN_012683 [Leptodophora sp. 'Broadleaf-Isolate-01']
MTSIRNLGKNVVPSFMSVPDYSSIELGNITQVTTSQDPLTSKSLPTSPARKGWKKGIIWAAGLALFVLVFNVLFLGIVIAKYGAKDGLGPLFTGDCDKASSFNSGIHVVINIMSTLLLGASNYVMQVLGAPTRAQVDAAHRKQVSLFIGVPNLRNLKWVGSRRLILWLLLCLSALPLHLFYNSAVFSTLQANQYEILVVSNEFFNSGTFDCNLENLKRPGGTGIGDLTDTAFCNLAQKLYDSFKAGELEFLDNVDCMKAYSVDFQSSRRNLLAVSANTGNISAGGTDLQNGTIFDYMPSTSWQDTVLTIGGSGWMANKWICSSPLTNYSRTFFSKEAQTTVTVCDSSLAIADEKNWKIVPNSVPIDYCLSERVPELCQLQFIVPIMIMVIVCNTVKFACILLAMLLLKDWPLVVIGDAISSFLDDEDEMTLGQCLTVAHSNHKKPVPQRKSGLWSVQQYQLSDDGKSRVWSHNVNRWFTAPRASNWILCIIFMSPSTIITWFSTSTSLDITSRKSSVLLIVIIITNTPQHLFSCLYFLYNALYTSMFSAYEILQYGRRRKPLRVSYPSGLQRSTYWLQLPMRYSVPLIVCSGSMHWLISQSLFLARISFFDSVGQPANIVLSNFQGLADTNILTLPGYSPKALVAAIVVGVVMILILIGTGLRKYDTAMPLMGNDCWAISTACHGPTDSDGAAKLGLSWGTIERATENGVGHCCFSSSEVERPSLGESYA